MLTSIELENYRGFSHYRLKNLARVNLLVGKNNCGKTSVLEAVQLSVSGAEPNVLGAVASQRGEVTLFMEDRQGGRGSVHPLVSHFFHGHHFGIGSHFAIRSGGATGDVNVRVRRTEESDHELRPLSPEEDLAVEVEMEDAAGKVKRSLVATGDGVIVNASIRGFSTWRRSGAASAQTRPIEFLTPASLDPRSMSIRWDKAVTEGRESEIVEAMQILEPDLTNIFFLSGDVAMRYGGTAGILVELKDPRRREPLGSHGDGMRRMLALALALIQAESGVLLVDEIDTGLHYSVIGQMWHLVTEAARRADVQVFATTHSQDCVRGLAWLCESFPNLRGEVSLQKIHPDLDEAVDLDADGIMLAVDQGMEVR